MLVNPEGTNPGDELLDALDNSEQEPTDEVDEDENDAAEAEGEGSDEELDPNAEDEDADAGEGDEADEGTTRYTVKVNGEEAKVTLTELKNGYMKDADYRRKTADIAETRKKVEAVEAEYTGGLKTLEGQLEVVATFIANQMNVDDEEMDKLAAEKPAEFVKVQREMAKRGHALQQVHNQLVAARQAQAQAAAKQAEAFRTAENARLAEVAPEFRNAETVERLHSYLSKTFGLTKEEIASVGDHRFTLIAEKARRFDAIKAKAALKDKQVKQAPAKFQRGGTANRNADTTKAKEQAFKKVMGTGRVDDLARLL